MGVVRSQWIAIIGRGTKKVENYCSRTGAPNLGYICLSERVHLMISIEKQNIFAYNIFPNIYTYISEYSF